MYLLQHSREDRLEPSPDHSAPHLHPPDKPWRDRLLQQEQVERFLPEAGTSETKYPGNLPNN